MTETHNHPTPDKTGAAEFQAYVSLGVTLAIMAVMLFWPAGTIDWRRGWLFMTLFVILVFVAMSWIRKDNPELFAVRSKYQKGTKGWDAIVASATILMFALILPVAALDDGRFRWAPTPDWVVVLGYVLLIAGFMGVTWAQAVNRHFETTVRIQTDRDHKVIDTGPYAHIRHPGYAFAILMASGTALSLGSLFALIPVGVLTALLIGRTLGEEGELIKGLPGYPEYMARVKWRWLPFIW